MRSIQQSSFGAPDPISSPLLPYVPTPILTHPLILLLARRPHQTEDVGTIPESECAFERPSSPTRALGDVRSPCTRAHTHPPRTRAHTIASTSTPTTAIQSGLRSKPRPPNLASISKILRRPGTPSKSLSYDSETTPSLTPTHAGGGGGAHQHQ